MPLFTPVLFEGTSAMTDPGAYYPLAVFSTRKCNTRFTSLDRKPHVESYILTFSSDAHTTIQCKGKILLNI